ncbi:hypothetical protein AVEN_104783-2 [Araneus ventricosus]|uniref:Uncharacterized protein n=1 Tax=Araneus ventricosus TaxID=182803 RepID=A0A4Y2TD89_ARAVE|nr:hypothetical protein AVEN_104783-2 [Araneus ventricosus]
MRMTLLCAEGRRVPFVRLLAIAASTCVDAPSSVTIFGLPDLLLSATESVLLNFLICFAMDSWVICVLCVVFKLRTTLRVVPLPANRRMTIRSSFVSGTSFPLLHLPQNEKGSHRFHHFPSSTKILCNIEQCSQYCIILYNIIYYIISNNIVQYRAKFCATWVVWRIMTYPVVQPRIPLYIASFIRRYDMFNSLISAHS